MFTRVRRFLLQSSRQDGGGPRLTDLTAAQTSALAKALRDAVPRGASVALSQVSRTLPDEATEVLETGGVSLKSFVQLSTFQHEAAIVTSSGATSSSLALFVLRYSYPALNARMLALLRTNLEKSLLAHYEFVVARDHVLSLSQRRAASLGPLVNGSQTLDPIVARFRTACPVRSSPGGAVGLGVLGLDVMLNNLLEKPLAAAPFVVPEEESWYRATETPYPHHSSSPSSAVGITLVAPRSPLAVWRERLWTASRELVRARHVELLASTTGAAEKAISLSGSLSPLLREGATPLCPGQPSSYDSLPSSLTEEIAERIVLGCGSGDAVSSGKRWVALSEPQFTRICTDLYETVFKRRSNGLSMSLVGGLPRALPPPPPNAAAIAVAPKVVEQHVLDAQRLDRGVSLCRMLILPLLALHSSGKPSKVHVLEDPVIGIHALLRRAFMAIGARRCGDKTDEGVGGQWSDDSSHRASPAAWKERYKFLSGRLLLAATAARRPNGGEPHDDDDVAAVTVRAAAPLSTLTDRSATDRSATDNVRGVNDDDDASIRATLDGIVGNIAILATDLSVVELDGLARIVDTSCGAVERKGDWLGVVRLLKMLDEQLCANALKPCLEFITGSFFELEAARRRKSDVENIHASHHEADVSTTSSVSADDALRDSLAYSVYDLDSVLMASATTIDPRRSHPSRNMYVRLNIAAATLRGSPCNTLDALLEQRLHVVPDFDIFRVARFLQCVHFSPLNDLLAISSDVLTTPAEETTTPPPPDNDSGEDGRRAAAHPNGVAVETAPQLPNGDHHPIGLTVQSMSAPDGVMSPVGVPAAAAPFATEKLTSKAYLELVLLSATHLFEIRFMDAAFRVADPVMKRSLDRYSAVVEVASVLDDARRAVLMSHLNRHGSLVMASALNAATVEPRAPGAKGGRQRANGEPTTSKQSTASPPVACEEEADANVNVVAAANDTPPAVASSGASTGDAVLPISSDVDVPATKEEDVPLELALASRETDVSGRRKEAAPTVARPHQSITNGACVVRFSLPVEFSSRSLTKSLDDLPRLAQTVVDCEHQIKTGPSHRRLKNKRKKDEAHRDIRRLVSDDHPFQHPDVLAHLVFDSLPNDVPVLLEDLWRVTPKEAILGPVLGVTYFARFPHLFFAWEAGFDPSQGWIQRSTLPEPTVPQPEDYSEADLVAAVKRIARHAEKQRRWTDGGFMTSRLHPAMKKRLLELCPVQGDKLGESFVRKYHADFEIDEAYIASERAKFSQASAPRNLPYRYRLRK